jgi:hypothetical protein
MMIHMTSSQSPSFSSHDAPAERTDNRRRGRCRVVEVRFRQGFCKGEVVDLSMSGLRLQCRGGRQFSSGDPLRLTLIWHDVKLPVRATVVWAKRTAAKMWTIGATFDDLEPSALAAIGALMQGAAPDVPQLTRLRAP